MKKLDLIRRYSIPTLALFCLLGFIAYMITFSVNPIELLFDRRSLAALAIAFPPLLLLGFFVGRKRNSMAAAMLTYGSWAVIIYIALVFIMGPAG